MLRLRVTERPLRVLDFDIENRPLSYIGSDFTSSDVTAIAAGWCDEADVDVRLLTKDASTQARMLKWFVGLYDQADVVTGHYIRRHDLPIVNGALIELGLPALGEKLVQDTKIDLVRKGDLPGSQEALSAMFGLPDAKHHMDQAQWRAANRLTPAGLEQTRKRVVDDVIQHQGLRLRLIEAGALNPPRMWYP